MNDTTHGLMSRIARRINTAIGWARITFTNDSGNAQLVQVQVNAAETIDNLPRIAEFGLTSVAPNGSDVAMVNLGGGRNNAVVVGTNHQASRPKGLKAGETMLYSQDGKSVYLTASGGIVIDAKGQDVAVNNGGTVTIHAQTKVIVDSPRLECTGDIVDNTATNSHSMAQMRAIFNSHTHPVVNIQTGGSTINTNAPSQTE